MLAFLAAVTRSPTMPSPTPTPVISTPAALPTTAVQLVTESAGPDFQPLWIAIVGVVGLSIAAWIAARSALRQRLMDVARAEVDKRAKFHVRAIAAVNDIGIANGLVIQYYEKAHAAAFAAIRQGPPPPPGTNGYVPLDPALLARVDAATAAWRTTLAESHLYTGGPLSDAINAFDSQRAVVTDAINGMNGLPAPLALAKAELQQLTDYYARHIYLLLQIEKVTGSGTIAHIAHRLFPRRYAVEWQKHIEGQIADAQNLIDGLTPPAAAPPPPTSP